MDLEKAFWTSAFGLACIGALAGIASLFMVAKSDGRVDYCRVVYYNENNVQLPVYIVEGHRNWRPDIRMAITRTAEEAESQRKALCPQ